MLGPRQFSLFINDVDARTVGTLSKPTDDTKLEAVSDALEHLAAIQKDLDMLKKLANKNVVQFNKIKCHILGRNNYKHHYSLGSSSLKKDLGILMKKL